jgi:hypothetical protein
MGLLLAQQMAKGADSAVGSINSPTEAKVSHVSLKYFAIETATRKPSSKIIQRSPVQIEADHIVTASGELAD